MGLLLVTRRNGSHLVKLFYGQAYIDCAVDGDNDPNTCISDFSVKKTFNFNGGYMFGSSLLLSGFFSLLQTFLHKQHHYSKILYLDSIFATSLMTFSIAVVIGNRNLSTLLLMVLNTFMYEISIYLHDIGFWTGKIIDPYNFRGRYILLIVLNGITLGVNIVALIEYWSTSKIPAFIPVMGVAWYFHFIMIRFFSYRYFYATLPLIIKKVSREERSMFKMDQDLDRYYVIKKEDPYVVDWFDSWKGGINFFFKMLVTLTFYFGTHVFKIT